jgi:hypothetical protein
MTSILKVDNLQNANGSNLINESGSVVTIGANGNTVALAAGATQTGFGGTNTPVAYYELTSNQSVSNATWTNISNWTAILSSANFSSGTFTVPSNGNYKITLIVRAGSGTSYNYYNSGARIGVNGSTYYPNYDSAVVNVILNLSSGNTITFDGYSQIAAGTPIFLASITQFSIVKLIGV